MNPRYVPWLFVFALWAATADAVLVTDQGIYEDTLYVHAFQTTTAPRVFAPRGLAFYSLWWQVQHGVTPVSMRAVNLALALTVALVAGLLTHRLGGTAWIAVGFLVAHPLLIETLAMMSGRLELIAALGVLLACLTVTGPWWAWVGVPVGLLIGLGGKESAIVALALMPLVLLCAPGARGWKLAALAKGLLLIIGAAWTYRLVGVGYPQLPQAPIQWALLQSAAAWRLCVLALVPWHQTIDFDYDAIPQLWRVAALASLMSLLCVIAHFWRTQRVVAIGLAWVLIVILPRLIIETPKSYLNEHQFYLALVGLAIGAASLGARKEPVYAT